MTTASLDPVKTWNDLRCGLHVELLQIELRMAIAYAVGDIRSGSTRRSTRLPESDALLFRETVSHASLRSFFLDLLSADDEAGVGLNFSKDVSRFAGAK